MRTYKIRYPKHNQVIRLMRVYSTSPSGEFLDDDQRMEKFIGRVGIVRERRHSPRQARARRIFFRIEGLDPLDTEDTYVYPHEVRWTHPNSLKTQRIIDRLAR